MNQAVAISSDAADAPIAPSAVDVAAVSHASGAEATPTGGGASAVADAYATDMFTYDITHTPWIAQTSKRIPEILKSHLRASGMPEHMVADKDVPYLLGAIWDGQLLDEFAKQYTSLAFASQQVDGVRVAVAHTDAAQAEHAAQAQQQAKAAEESDEQKRKDTEENRVREQKLWSFLVASRGEDESFIEAAVKFLGKMLERDEKSSKAFDVLSRGVESLQGLVHFTPAQQEAIETVRAQLRQFMGGDAPVVHSADAHQVPPRNTGAGTKLPDASHSKTHQDRLSA